MDLCLDITEASVMEDMCPLATLTTQKRLIPFMSLYSSESGVFLHGMSSKVSEVVAEW